MIPGLKTLNGSDTAGLLLLQVISLERAEAVGTPGSHGSTSEKGLVEGAAFRLGFDDEKKFTTGRANCETMYARSTE